MEIIIKKYEHINSSFRNWDTPKGKYISSKRQYEDEMAKGGFVDYDTACQMAEKAREKQNKPLKLSKKAKEILICAKNSSNKKGGLHLSDKLIDGMKEVGVNFYSSNIPKHYRIDQGGFDATN